MRKALLSILLILCITLLVLFIKNGMHIGPFQVYGFKNIKEKNTELTQTISSANAQSEGYTSALQKLQSDVELLTKAKKDYLDLVAQSTDSEIEKATQTKIYTIEYLWSKVGNYATQQGVSLENISLSSSTLNNKDYCNLNFTVKGEYLAITQFITKLENDASLDFIIDDFHMTSSQATFVVKDVRVQRELTSSTEPDYSGTDTPEDNSSQTDQPTEPEVTVSEDGSKTKVLGGNS